MPPTSLSAHSCPVLFLRSPSTDTPDPYESAFSTAGYYPIVSIPVLETALTNISDLARVILKGPGYEDDDYHCSGVIMTSARACEAWKAAVESIISSHSNEADGGFPYPPWSAIPFYVVGSSTASSLSSLRPVISSSYGNEAADLAPAPDAIHGQESGNSEELAKFILHNLTTHMGGEEKKKRSLSLLFLTGDKTRQTLLPILVEGGVQLRSIKVYETRGAPRFREDLGRVVDSCAAWVNTNAGEGRDWWIVFFAPSSANFVVPILEEYFSLPSSDAGYATVDHTMVRQNAKLAAIGSTTLTFLHDTLRLHVSATAAKPSAESLLNVIQQADYVVD